MTSIPDSISTSALKALAEEAPADIKLPTKHMTPDEMQSLVVESIEELTDKFDSIFGYKLAAHYCLYKLFMHHNDAHKNICENGDFETAICWARDAGWLQMMIGNLTNIDCGPEDYLSPDVD
jgi:hypothetical protein